jgi:AAA+ superfamily predicted ATPase
MDMGQLKTQIMTMLMMKLSASPGSKGMGDIFQILYGMMLMNLIEWVFKTLPDWQTFTMKWIDDRYGKKKTDWMPMIAKQQEKVVVHSVTMTRAYGNKSEKVDNVYVEKVDAVLDYICALDSAQHIRIDTRFSVNNVEEIVLTPQLKAKVKTSAGSGQEEVSQTDLVVFSNVLKVSEIRSWIDEVHDAYVAEKNNKLGNKTYYFDEMVAEPLSTVELMPDGSSRKSYRWDSMPKLLTFTMNEFRTSKSFENVYGCHVDELKERLDLFVNHPEWYKERGIPYSLGILLHGVAGSGKTSTIKAIAHDTQRHIFNLSLREFTTQRQLTNLFFNETVVVQNYDGGKMTLKIPLNKRVYVIEDIDCLTDVALDRRFKKNEENGKGDGLTLSFLLNLLDGVLETPGRILVITSNYPEKLDHAFVRPGRIDVKIEFKRASRLFILNMINRFYGCSFTLDAIPEDLEDVFTPAEVMESMCTYFKDPTRALIHLTQKKSPITSVETQNIGTRLESLGAVSTAVYESGKKPEPVFQAELHDELLKESRCDDCRQALGPCLDCIEKDFKDGNADQIFKYLPNDEKPENSVVPIQELKKTVKRPGFFGSLWGQAEFEDAVIPEGAGGDMPGAKGVRSSVNLNELH